MGAINEKTGLDQIANGSAMRGALTIGGALTVALGAGLPAHADFITTNFAPGTILDLNNGTPSFNVDLNGDGTPDFTLGANNDLDGIFIDPLNGNSVVQDTSFSAKDTTFAAALASSSLISPSSDFTTNDATLVKHLNSSTGDLYGPWNGNGDAFLGLEFFDPADGQNHLGFIEGNSVSTAPADGSLPNDVITLESYGYDPDPVPEPGSLALLAAGAMGVAALRRRNRKSAKA